MAVGVQTILPFTSGLSGNPTFDTSDAQNSALTIPGMRYWFKTGKLGFAGAFWSGTAIRDIAASSRTFHGVLGSAFTLGSPVNGNLGMAFGGTNYIIGPSVFPTVAAGFTGDYTKYFLYTTGAALPPAAGNAMICGNGASYHTLIENTQGRVVLGHNLATGSFNITQTVGSVLTRSTTYLVEQTYTAGGQTKVFLYKAGAPNDGSVLDTQSTGSPAFTAITDTSIVVGAYASGLVGKPSITCYEGGVIARDMSLPANAADRALLLTYLKTEYGMLV